MHRRAFLATAAVATLAPPVAAQVPAAAKPARIGILSLRQRAEPNPLTEALVEGLRERGYIDGRNVVIEFPDALGHEDRLPDLAAGLVRSGVDVILVIGPAPLPAARNATRSIPIVMVASSADPVAEGIAASIARPGGNVTGLTYAEPDRFKKQLELLKGAAPRVARVAVLWDFDVDVFRRFWERPLGDAARLLGMSVQAPVRVRTAAELPDAFAAMKKGRADAFLVAAGGVNLPARAEIAMLALEHRLPGIAAFREFPQAGLLMSYGPDLPDINRRAGGYVDRILRGAKPGDLPIELPNRFELVVNLKTAKALGLSLPQPLLLRATEIVR
jgi:putative ABC transport system substrate-binding protein